MGSHEPFEHLHHKLWQKERSDKKSGIDPTPMRARGVKGIATHHWKTLDESYNFALDLVPIGDLTK
jgi:hypothetical protein